MSSKGKDETAKAIKQFTTLVGEEASIIRAALRAMLAQIEGVRMVGDVRIDDLVETGRKLEPDLVLMSVPYPQPRYISIAKALAGLPKSPGVMILSRFKDPEFLHDFFKAGGSACIFDGAPVTTLSAAFRRVAAGGKYIDPDVSDETVVALIGEPGRPRAGALSRREEEVLRSMAQGYTQKEIAQELGISPATVETYRARIAEKLDLHGRSDLVRYALLRGILKADDGDAA